MNDLQAEQDHQEDGLLNNSPADSQFCTKKKATSFCIGGIILAGLIFLCVYFAKTESDIEPTKIDTKERDRKVNHYYLNESKFLYEDIYKFQMLLSYNKDTTYMEDEVAPNDTFPAVEELLVNITSEDDNRMHIKITDAKNERWEVPHLSEDSDLQAGRALPFQHYPIKELINDSLIIHKDPFSVELKDKKTNKTVLSTNHNHMKFMDHYIEYELTLTTQRIFGLGQRNAPFVYKNGTYTIFNRDHLSPREDGKGGKQMYGSHNFFLNQLEDGQFIGVVMWNSNHQDIVIEFKDDGTSRLTYKMIGGVIDLYVFYAASADYIIRKYHALIGRPTMVPMWALGFHQCRWGYHSQAELEAIVKKYDELDLPLEVMWSDIDYMVEFEDFVVDKSRYPNLTDFVDWLHSRNQYFVPITDAGFKKKEGYHVYDKGLEKGLYIMSAKTKKALLGVVWPGPSVYIDFWHPEAEEFWIEGLEQLYEMTHFDGTWLDMNELANFVDGELIVGEEQKEKKDPVQYLRGGSQKRKLIKEEKDNDPHEFDKLPYIPGNNSEGSNYTFLEKHTISITGYHHAENEYERKNHKEFNLHSLNAFMEARATNHYYKKHKKRPFIITRASFMGSGHFTSAWLGDNTADWDQMQSSISGILNMNMFGIPLIGADIGGFFGSPEPELMIKWLRLGAFYPFTRDHSANDTKMQEPWEFGEEGIHAARTAVRQKYSFLWYYYTKLFESSLWGGPALKPLLFEFPKAHRAIEFTDNCFLIGEALLVSPALQKGQNESVSQYFPNHHWYDVYSGEQVVTYSKEKGDEGVTLDLHIGHNPDMTKLHLKGGSIIPYQDAIANKVSRTKQLFDIKFTLLIALDHENKAHGTMIVDDGVSADPTNTPNGGDIFTANYRHYSWVFEGETLRVNILNGYNYTNSYDFETFHEVLIYGAKNLSDVHAVWMITSTMSKKRLRMEFNETSNIMKIWDPSSFGTPWWKVESLLFIRNLEHNYVDAKYKAHDIMVYDTLRALNATLFDDNDRVEQHYRPYALNVKMLTDHALNLKIEPMWYDVREPPKEVLREGVREKSTSSKTFHEFYFSMTEYPDLFNFEIADLNHPDKPFLSNKGGVLIMRPTFVEFKYMIIADRVYGLGERVGKFTMESGTYTLFTHDQTPSEDGIPPGKNMYGMHPFYMFKLASNEFVGVFMLTANAMDINFHKFGTRFMVDHRMAGGIVDMFVIQRGSVDLIIKEYHNLIGKPTLVPFWSFGVHHCRWGYKSQAELQAVVDGYANSKIPLDVVWNDIDYMKRYRGWTLDEERYPAMHEFISKLHEKNMKYVPMVDPNVKIEEGYHAYDSLVEMGCFIKDPDTGKPTVGVMWPGYCTYPDFWHPAAYDYWKKINDILHDKLPFDGLWIDMNEIVNFGDGNMKDNLTFLDLNPHKKWDALPYIPGHRSLNRRNMDISAVHYGDPKLDIELNLHSLFAFMEAKYTNKYFTEEGKRPFIISRSSFAGMGKYASHWLGDNKSRWEFLKYSIAGIFNFHMFGIPLVGPDTCGFNENMELEMCRRWYQLAIFYPFMRNHNALGTKDQEPYKYPELAKTARETINYRYSLIRYQYSLYMDVAMNGGTYFYPLFYLFPDDAKLFEDPESTFMFGKLKVTPVLEPNKFSISSHFPNANWYSFPQGERLMTYDPEKSEGQEFEFPADLETGTVNVHILGGNIVCHQANTAMTIHEVTQFPVTLYVAPDHENKAKGFVIYDEGEGNDTLSAKKYDKYTIEYALNKITFTTDNTYDRSIEFKDDEVTEVVIFGAEDYSETNFACAGSTAWTPEYLEGVLRLKAPNPTKIKELSTLEWGSGTASCQLKI